MMELEIHQYSTETEFPFKAEGVWHFPSYVGEKTVIDWGGETVCTIHQSLPASDILKFARLFTAAPEMLKALELCHDIMHDMVAEGRSDPSGYASPDLEAEAAFFTLRAAMVQATNDPDHIKSFILDKLQP